MSSRPSDYQETTADFDLLDLHQLNPERYPYLLQSKSIGPQGRFDILFAFPGESIEFDPKTPGYFLDQLDRQFKQEALTDRLPDPFPFTGGWFLYLGYELAEAIEPSLSLPDYKGRLPTAFATRIPAAIVHDHTSGSRVIVSEDKQLFAKIKNDIVKCKPNRKSIPLGIGRLQEEPGEKYTSAVEKIIDYIVEGDVFQVNLSRQWSATIDKQLDNAALYKQLRAANPGPFNGMVTWKDQALFSSSPERLVSMQGDAVET
ncbi:MAG: chorismate-binding protein, partial [Gammaproteobacteria bacterium]